MRKKSDTGFITIKDVAKEAEVSIATVSRVINDSGKVKPEKKRKILDAIKKLNYVPNFSARNLASVNNTKRIALLLPEIDRIPYAEVAKGCKDILDTYSYDIAINSYNSDEKIKKKLLDQYEMNSECKAIIQLTNSEYENKKIEVDWNDSNIEYKKVKNDKKNKIGIFTLDKYMEEFILNNLLKNGSKYDSKNEYDCYVTVTVEEGMFLYNNGIKEKPIFILEKNMEINQICSNIKNINFDFYGLGAALARIAIKMLNNQPIQKVKLEIKEYNV